MKLKSVRFQNAGYCSQFARLSGVRSWRWSRFQAVVVFFEHPKYGWNLIDTGYGPSFWRATRSFPELLYRWSVPPSISDDLSIGGAMARSQIASSEIQRIFLSHYHADHVAGLNDLSDLQIVYRKEPLQELRRQSRLGRLHHGFLPELIPSAREENGQPIREEQFTSLSSDGFDLRSWNCLDYWGDGSLILIDLPGHALGHTGYLLRTETRDFFYIVDACWNVDVLQQGGKIPFPATRVQHDYKIYRQTQQQLRDFAQSHDVTMLACHCPKTQHYVDSTPKQLSTLGESK